MTTDTPDPRRPDAIVVYRALQRGPADVVTLAGLFKPSLDPSVPETTRRAIYKRSYERADLHVTITGLDPEASAAAIDARLGHA